MSRRSSGFVFPALLALAFAALTVGCDEVRTPVLSSSVETDHPDFIEGRRLREEGKKIEALVAFGKVIVARADAPESHLEAGLIASDMNDPLLAIFHFRQFLLQRPGSQHAPRVREQIRGAEKKFLEKLPFIPAESNTDARIATLTEQIKLLRRENDDLKVRIASGVRTALPNDPASRLGGGPVPVPPAGPATAVSPTTPAPTSSLTPAAAANIGKRRHVIAKGDTLASISQKYYGTKNRWQEILNANRDVMKTERDLKIGKELVIP